MRDPIDAGLLVQPFANASLNTGIGYDLVMTKEASKRPEVDAFVEWLKRITGSH